MFYIIIELEILYKVFRFQIQSKLLHEYKVGNLGLFNEIRMCSGHKIN
uniref:Uncharacterized protein n=1 Tax=Heterorhabditis bacteriophora TaxID=37862 RepID=A0A1I7WI77_HETBA